ncbi:MAG TPA: hypothetical protein VK447_17400 [Myxococcaceae bacterium]|nr:hypothetical protein [Myxococcaceae bacterium]
MQFSMKHGVPLLAAVALLGATASEAQDAPKLTVGGTTYTKFLFGTNRYQGAMYNFTSIPGEGYGDNGQGSEVELLLNARLSRQVEVKARLHSRFNQNFWTNFGGFLVDRSKFLDPNNPCLAGDCGELDPRSNQYVKLRGVTVTLTPGYWWLDTANIGASDLGQFDPFVVGRIRYIDRDNSAGIFLSGNLFDRAFTWDAARISLSRLWAGPNYNTGIFHASDAAYTFQGKYTLNEMFDVNALYNWVDDIEVDALDTLLDNGKAVRTRYRNSVFGVKAGLHLSPQIDLRGSYYYSSSASAKDLAPRDFFGLSGFSPVPAGIHRDASWKANLDLNDPLGIGLSLFVEGFSIGADYVALLAARRESDVLLTEGHDSTFALPGPSNASFGTFKGNPTRIGYGGWDGNAQQVATINVDNEFTDFDEPMAETVIGWKGVTIAPVYTAGPLDLSGEYTYITYNTNWQAFGDDTRPVTSSLYPVAELDTGVGHNFRSAYAPFQDKTTHLLVGRAKYVLDIGTGLEVFGKVKYIKENDKRLNNAKYLPFQPGDCPTTPMAGAGCSGNKNFYSAGNTTADIYGNPDVVTVNGVTGYKWKPFDSITDDDRDLSYLHLNLGVGYQLTDDLYASLSYSKFMANLLDGNTAMQGYNLHEMASGYHDKNQVTLKAKYVLAGAEFGFEYQYNFGFFQPNFGEGFVPQIADATIAADHNVAVGSLGFSNRFGGWNSLEQRNFEQHRMKAYMKVQF